MDSHDVVLNKTGDGIRYYERCGVEAGIPALSRIFAMLSEDERRHGEALRAWHTGATVDLPQSKTLEGARFLLRHLAVQGGLERFNGDLDNFGRAMQFEAASVRLYGQLAREAQHHGERELYAKIAAEDEIHFTLLEQMRELVEALPEEPSDGLAATDRGNDAY